MFIGMDDAPSTSSTTPEPVRNAPVPFATRLERSLIREMKVACIRRGVTMQVGVAAALRAWIDSEG